MPSRCYQNTYRLDGQKCGDSWIPDDAECNQGQGGKRGNKGLNVAAGLTAIGSSAALYGAGMAAKQVAKKGRKSRIQETREGRNASRRRREAQRSTESGFSEFSKEADQVGATKTKKPKKDRRRGRGAIVGKTGRGATVAAKHRKPLGAKKRSRRMGYTEDAADIELLTNNLQSLLHNDSASLYDISYAQHRLDAALTVYNEDGKKCGDSWIPDDAECNQGQGSKGSGGKLAAGLAATGLLAAAGGGAYAVHRKREKLNKGKSDKDKVGYAQAAGAVGQDVKKAASRTVRKGKVAAARAGRKVKQETGKLQSKAKNLGKDLQQAGADFKRGATEIGEEVGQKAQKAGKKAKRKALRGAATVRRTAKKAKKTFSNNEFDELNEDSMYTDVASLAAAGQMMLTAGDCDCPQCRNNQPCSCR